MEHMMETIEIFKLLVEQIHTTIIATNDENGDPVTCAVDMMDYDENSLYFLTAKGKGFYKRLNSCGILALTGLKGETTMTSLAVSVCGKVREVGAEMLPLLIAKNPYMNEIYPDAASRNALTVFQIYEGSGEWFDLFKKPIKRASFTFGEAKERTEGYYITEKCIGCASCEGMCPQRCIDVSVKPAVIRQQNCLHCGNCYEICPAQAIIKRGLAYGTE